MCRVDVQLEPIDPVAPVTITARATVANGSGVLDYQWTVTRGADPIAATPRTPDGRDIDFIANMAGIHHVALAIPGCDGWSGDVNVRDPAADERTLRLRFTPSPDSDVPSQERVITVPGGVDYVAGVIALEAGLTVPIVVRDGPGASVPAYVRLISRSTPDVFVELVTGAAGTDVVQLLPGRVDVLIVPLAADLAPRRHDDWAPLIDALIVDGGQVATGVVRDPSGAPLAGARVTMAADDGAAPSTIATTAADGSFAIRWRPPAAAALTVVPPAASGLPRLTAPLTDLALDRALTIRYAAATITRDLAGTLVRVDGAIAAGGHATFAIDVAAAATIGDGAITRAAVGKHRDTVAIDGAGRLTAYRATAAAGRAYLRGATGPGAVALIDLGAAVPASLDGAAPLGLAATVVDNAGQPIRNAHLRAILTGDLAHLGAATPTANADLSGQATLLIAPGATYQLEVSDPRRGHATVHVLAGAGAPLAPIELPDAIAIRGEVRRTGLSTGLPSVGVTALCYGCDGLDRSRPLGDAVTDVGGVFAVAIPDPGTSQ